MPSIQNFYKKIITNAGKKSLPDLKVKSKYRAFTLIEILLVILIISSLLLASDGFIFLSKAYYQYRQSIVIKKIKNLLEFAKNTANISNSSVIICPSKNLDNIEIIEQTCSSDWHDPIVIFYNNHKNTLYNKEKIIFISQNLINNKESIILKNFQHKNYIKFNNNSSQQPPNGTIQYKNMYYNRSIIINRIGRVFI